MAIDPEISLGIKPPEFGGSNPLALMGGFAALQNQLNQAKLFQQTFAARQRAGEIIASSDPNDPESAIRGLTSDPLVSGYAPQIIGDARGWQQSLVAMRGAQQTQASSAYDGFMKNLGAVYNDPSQFQFLKSSVLSSMALGTARDMASKSIDDLGRGLTFGLDKIEDPKLQQKVVQNRVLGLMVAHGATPDVLSTFTGKPIQVDTGGGIKFGVQAPPQQGGGATFSDGVGKTLSPQLHDVGGIPLQFGGGGGATAPSGTSSTNALGASTVLGKPSPQGPGSAASAGDPDAVSRLLRIQGLGKANEAMAAKAGELQDEMSTNSTAVPATLRRLDIMTDTLRGFQAGGGAEWRSHLGQFLQALHNAGADFVTDKMVQNVANGSLSDSQVFMAAVKPFVIGQLKEAAQGTGRVMKSEVDTFLQMLSGSTDPAAIMKVLDLARYRLQVGYDMSQKFVDFKQGIKSGALSGWDITDFPTYYNRQFGDKPLPLTNPGGGFNLGPGDTTGIKGLKTGPGKKFRYDKDGNLITQPQAP